MKSLHRIFHSHLTLNPFLTKLGICQLYPLCSTPLIYILLVLCVCGDLRKKCQSDWSSNQGEIDVLTGIEMEFNTLFA